ncbi:MAG: D-2-hydroxyacid dehydrogenase [Flavobacteriaceae bacterium]|nr:D-2-hydroxyacid dehydrogenase [Flavobacteriaceae bacterium]
MKVLANDGLSKSGVETLEKNGFEVITLTVAQEQLINYINENNISVILVRSATKVRKDIIDACPSLKIIGRGGVGMDNIDVEYARKQKIHVINTPKASSASVAELVIAHLFSGARFLHNANRNMPLEGDTKFKDLKKNYASGMELRGKTMGIIGFGRIGREVAKIALGCGMKVLASDKYVGKATVKVEFYNKQFINVEIETEPVEDILKDSDFVSLHVPAQNDYIIGKKEIGLMKDGAVIINAARGGLIDEQALLDALDDGKLSFAALDTFENEPTPSLKVLMNGKLSLSPHIGAATLEAQERIGLELASQINSILKTES